MAAALSSHNAVRRRSARYLHQSPFTLVDSSVFRGFNCIATLSRLQITPPTHPGASDFRDNALASTTGASVSCEPGEVSSPLIPFLRLLARWPDGIPKWSSATLRAARDRCKLVTAQLAPVCGYGLMLAASRRLSEEFRPRARRPPQPLRAPHRMTVIVSARGSAVPRRVPNP